MPKIVANIVTNFRFTFWNWAFCFCCWVKQ